MALANRIIVFVAGIVLFPLRMFICYIIIGAKCGLMLYSWFERMSKAPRKAAKASIKRLKSSDRDKRSEETVEVRQSERLKNMKRTTGANAVDNSAATSSGKGPGAGKYTKRAKAAPATPDEDPCPICLDDVINAKKLECGHVYCSLCIDEAFKVRGEICPICGRMFGVLIGNQPDGHMTYRVIAHHLPGFYKCNTIEISYYFENGIQGVSVVLE